MDHLTYHNHDLYLENVPLIRVAEKLGTPCYVYSRAALEHNWQLFDKAFSSFKHRICYAVKANSNIAILNILARLGSGFDIVSGGELKRVLAAGGDPTKIIFSGIGKTAAEIREGLLAGISCFNVEVFGELDRMNEIAGQLNKRAPIALRINPNVDAGTHPYITTGLKDNKFGIPMEDAIATYEYASRLPNLDIVGIAFHIGSQQLELEPFAQALQKVAKIVEQLAEKNISLQMFDIGGGMGVRYHDEIPPAPELYAAILGEVLTDKSKTVIVEPGRAIAANAGVLLTRVEYLKQAGDSEFAIVDAGMNDLMRPSLYQAWHDIVPVMRKDVTSKVSVGTYDVVGPVCESSDFLGKKRQLQIEAGDILAVCSAGAYGFSMSSNYNSRPRACEVMVDGENYYVIREREEAADLFQLEKMLSEYKRM